MTLPRAIHAAVHAAMHGHHSRIPALGCEWMTEPGSPDLHIDQLGARHHVVMPCDDIEAVADNLVYRLVRTRSSVASPHAAQSPAGRTPVTAS
jgi:hypothetical protein